MSDNYVQWDTSNAEPSDPASPHTMARFDGEVASGENASPLGYLAFEDAERPQVESEMFRLDNFAHFYARAGRVQRHDNFARPWSVDLTPLVGADPQGLIVVDGNDVITAWDRVLSTVNGAVIYDLANVPAGYSTKLNTMFPGRVSSSSLVGEFGHYGSGLVKLGRASLHTPSEDKVLLVQVDTSNDDWSLVVRDITSSIGAPFVGATFTNHATFGLAGDRILALISESAATELHAFVFNNAGTLQASSALGVTGLEAATSLITVTETGDFCIPLDDRYIVFDLALTDITPSWLADTNSTISKRKIARIRRPFIVTQHEIDNALGGTDTQGLVYNFETGAQIYSQPYTVVFVPGTGSVRQFFTFPSHPYMNTTWLDLRGDSRRTEATQTQGQNDIRIYEMNAFHPDPVGTGSDNNSPVAFMDYYNKGGSVSNLLWEAGDNPRGSFEVMPHQYRANR